MGGREGLDSKETYFDSILIKVTEYKLIMFSFKLTSTKSKTN